MIGGIDKHPFNQQFLRILICNSICWQCLKEFSPIFVGFSNPIFLRNVRNVDDFTDFSPDFEEETYGDLMDEYGA